MAATPVVNTLPNGKTYTTYEVTTPLPNGGSINYATNPSFMGGVSTIVKSSSGETLASQGQTKEQVLNELADKKTEAQGILNQQNATIAALQQKSDAATTPEEKASLDRRIAIQQSRANATQETINSVDAATADVHANYDTNAKTVTDATTAAAESAAASPQQTTATAPAEAQAASQQTAATANTGSENDTSGSQQVAVTPAPAPPPPPPPVEQVAPAPSNVQAATPVVEQGPPDPYAGLTDAQKEKLGQADPTDPYIRARLGLPPYNADTPVTGQEERNINGTGAGILGAAAGASVSSVAEQKSDIAGTKQITAIGGNQVKTAGPTPNPLDAYASYTYNLTLHVLTREDYNTMTKTPTAFKPTKTLISSAGRYGTSWYDEDAEGNLTGPYGRDPAFKEDFYFDSFKMETVVGLNANTRGTNAITMDFTIIEPYGMTLLDRLMDVNNKDLNGKNYLDMPYLLEISFFGATDDGTMKKIEDHTKWFPIKIINFKIKADVKGAEYAIQAVPFNHSANLETIQSLKTRMHVTASTVGEYFSSTLDTVSAKAVNDAIDEETQRKQKTQPKSDAEQGGGQSSENTRKEQSADKTKTDQQPIVINTSSFTAAYNAWFESQQKKGSIATADVISFKFVDPLLAASKIVDAKKNSVRKVADTSPTPAAQSNNGLAAVTTNFDSIVHDLEAGTTINEIINLILPQSEYFLNQIKDSSTEAKEKEQSKSDSATQTNAKPLSMWKIIPSVELTSYDKERNIWGRNITFTIKPYNVFQKRDDRLPQSPPPKPVKQYDYIYTGKNTSIISFDIDFNALYFTAKNVDKGAKSAATGASQISEEKKNNEKPDDNQNNKQIGQEVTQPVADDHSTSAGGASARSETINAKSALNSVYTSAAGDMINLKLQIIGDPEFIKQDDLFISPISDKGSQTPDPSNPYVPGTKSLDMDYSEIYCYVTFKTPSDFNDETGMYDLDSKQKYKVSEFSGYYRAITVTNEFRGGKFTQTLNLIRQPKQDPINQSAASSTTVATEGQDQRKKDKNTVQTGNPSVSGNNQEGGAGGATTPAQSSQADKVTKGPDGDGSVVNATPSSTALQNKSAEQTQSKEDQELSQIAKSGSSTSIDGRPPAENTSGTTVTGATGAAADNTTGASGTGASTAGANSSSATLASQGGAAKNTSGPTNTGESVVAPESGVSKDSAAATVQASLATINGLKAQNEALSAQRQEAAARQEAAFAEFEAASNEFGSNPTPDQKAQLRQLKQNIQKARSERSSLQQQIQANAEQAAQESEKANEAASKAGIQGLNVTTSTDAAGNATIEVK